jgi:hypothetical protein
LILGCQINNRYIHVVCDPKNECLATIAAFLKYLCYTSDMTNNQQRMPEYHNLIDRYIDKWDKILFSTQPLDRDKATQSVIDAYHAIELASPEIFFVSSPSLEQNSFFLSVSYDDNPFPIRIKNLIYDKVIATLEQTPIKDIDLDPRLTLENIELYSRGEIFENLCSILYSEHIYDIHCDRNMNFHKTIEYELSGTNVWPFDFYINHISDRPDTEIWNILKSLCEECPYLITYEKVCIIIERPAELYLDRDLAPHAEGKAAIRYTDGYELYCHHGTIIPKKYGRVHPSDWKADWILADEDEDNHEINRGSIITLLTEVGFKKFSKELPSERGKYWTKQGALRDCPGFLNDSQIYIDCWLQQHYADYHKFGEFYPPLKEVIDWEAHRKQIEGWYERQKKIYRSLPFKISEELERCYHMYEEGYPIAPGLDFYSLLQATKNFISKSGDYLLPIFHGDRQEKYYIVCDNTHRSISPVYYQAANEEPIVYAECISSLITTIAQCYRDGGYYIAIDEQSGEKQIKQDLDKIEPIFEKFNPDQIDNWRQIWKA